MANYELADTDNGVANRNSGGGGGCFPHTTPIPLKYLVNIQFSYMGLRVLSVPQLGQLCFVTTAKIGFKEKMRHWYKNIGNDKSQP